MERRQSKSIFLGFDAEIISGAKSYSGIISNLSENGVNVYVETGHCDSSLDCTPGTALQLKFQPISKETLYLQGTVVWSQKTLPHGLTSNIGIKIMEPPWDKSVNFL